MANSTGGLLGLAGLIKEEREDFMILYCIWAVATMSGMGRDFQQVLPFSIPSY